MYSTPLFTDDRMDPASPVEQSAHAERPDHAEVSDHDEASDSDVSDAVSALDRNADTSMSVDNVPKGDASSSSASQIVVPTQAPRDEEHLEGEIMSEASSASKVMPLNDTSNIPRQRELSEHKTTHRLLAEMMPQHPVAEDARFIAGIRASEYAAERAQQLQRAVMKEDDGQAKPRLIIEQIVMDHFKSYGGRAVIGPFHPTFSAVVGPNGSGKSNTIDALLFVFGFRANKMRQGKLSELIHNSDANTERADSCTVEVHFRKVLDREDGSFEVVPNSQLVVARTAYRNNTSKFTMDGKWAQLNQVKDVLKSLDIDLDHNRFLILQGEVESIAQMKPKGLTEDDEGLLEYLEDIIGTDKYKQDISDALQAVESTGVVRMEKVTRVKHVQKEIHALGPRKREADQYIQDKNALAQAHSNLLQRAAFETSKEITQAERKRAEAQAVWEPVKRAYDAKLAESSLLQKDLDKNQKDLHRAEAKLNDARQHAKACEKQELQSQDRQKQAQKSMSKIQKQIEADQTVVRTTDQKVNKAEQDLASTEARIADVKKELDKEQAQLDSISASMEGKTDAVRREIEAIQESSINPLTQEMNGRRAELQLVNQKIAHIQAQLADLSSDAESEAAERIANIQTELSNAESLLAQHSSELDSYRANLVPLTRQVHAAEVQHASEKETLSGFEMRLREVLAASRSQQSESRVLETLNRMKEQQGRLQHLRGRLGSLGFIDDKYDVAISTACPRLRDLVCDTLEGGQEVLDAVRRNQLGRVSIMCIDKLNVNAQAMDNIPQTPRGAKRLFDLVQVNDPAIRKVFYFALRDTLVAENMEDAMYIAYGTSRRWRVVTLDGKLIDTSGTMSGGGNSVIRGLMSNRPPPLPEHEVESLKRKVAESRDAFAKTTEALNQKTSSLETSKARIEELTSNISTLKTLDIPAIVARLDDARRALSNVRKDSASRAQEASSAQRELGPLQGQVAALEASIADLEQKHSTFLDQIKDKQNQILAMGGRNVVIAQTIVDGLMERYEEARSQRQSLHASIDKIRRDAQRSAAQLQDASARLEAARADLEEAFALVKEKQNAVQEATEHVQAAEHSVADIQEHIGKIKANIEEHANGISDLRRQESDLSKSVRDAEARLPELQGKLKSYFRHLRHLELFDAMGEIDSALPEDSDESAAMDVDGQNARPILTEIHRNMPARLARLSEQDIAALNPHNENRKIANLQESLKTLVDLSILAEYAARERELDERQRDLDDTTATHDTARAKYDTLCSQRTSQFLAGFHAISAKVKEMYQMITMGGNAELELVDSLDPFSEGVLFSVMPPRKSWRNISNLSGGEKTLSSLALVFALHEFKPTPLYFMDEIDAALDFKNVSIVANYIKSRTKNAQFIIISLRNNMFELAARLVGIYKTHNKTKSVAIDNASWFNIVEEPEGDTENLENEPPSKRQRIAAAVDAQ